MSTFNLLCEAISNAVSPPAPVVPLELDFICAADPMLQNFPSIAIPGLPCPESSFTIAYWLATGRLYNQPLPVAMSFAAILQRLKLMPSVNIHFCVYNPAPILVHSCFVSVHGVPRADGWRMVYIPPGVAGVAHLAMLQMSLPVDPSLPFQVAYYGSTPLLSPLVYWHATRTSSVYYMLKAQGRACLCRVRCQHEKVFSGDVLLPTASYGSNTDYQLEVLNYQPPFCRGAQRSITYIDVDGVVHRDPHAFHIELAVDLPTAEYVVNQLTMRWYDLRVTKMPDLHSVRALARCSALGVLSSVLTYKPAVSSSLWTRLKASSYHSSWKNLLPGRVVDVKPSFSFRPLFVALAVTTALYLSARLPHWLWCYFTRSQYLLQSEPASLTRTWLPNSMRFLPFTRELQNRMAVSAFDAPAARSYLRRACYEMKHELVLQPSEVDAWLDEVVTSTATAPIPIMPLGVCYLCLQKKNLTRCLCNQCRRFPVWLDRPEPSAFVGLRPLFSSHPQIALGVVFDPDVSITYKGMRILNTTTAMEIYKSEAPRLTCMGRLAGPMWLGHEATCYTQGELTLLVAAAVRIGVPCTNKPLAGFWPAMRSLFNLVVPFLPHLVPLEQVEVLARQKNSQKREKLRQMYVDYNNGDMPNRKHLQRFGGFAKLEKHVRAQHDGVDLKFKAKLAPRLINSPHPMVNAMMAPFTLPLADWFHHQFDHTSHLFYAGCSTPQQLNEFLDLASSQCQFVLEDDVSMMDKSHSSGSQNFMYSIIQDLYLGVYLAVLNPLLRQIRKIKIQQGAFRAELEDANASGVPVTSFLNSLCTMFVRLNALVEAYFDIDYTHSYYPTAVKIVLIAVFMAVAGDDGKLFCPASINGVDTFSPAWMARYIAAWAKAGFDVGPSKIKTFSPANWRLSTFLAMRPYWNGSRYYYGVEISRRMRTMFWMLNKSTHPIAWGRGVATSLLVASPHVPIVKDVCIWYLDRTKGPTITDPLISFTNIDSLVYGYKGEGELCERTIQEFCSDYGLTRHDYEDFRNYLWTFTNVLVNLDHYVLRRIASFE